MTIAILAIDRFISVKYCLRYQLILTTRRIITGVQKSGRQVWTITVNWQTIPKEIRQDQTVGTRFEANDFKNTTFDMSLDQEHSQ